MATYHIDMFMSLLLLSIFLQALSSSAADSGAVLTYIIQVRPPAGNSSSTSSVKDLEDYYKSFLPKTQKRGGDGGDGGLVHAYGEVFSGFAAKLTAEELEAVAKTDGFVAAFPDQELPLATTHTPDFLGLHVGSGLWRSAAPGLGKGAIIGVLDTGFTPGHPSFGDAGMPAPPATWHGTCYTPAFCNRKVIGARDFTRTTPQDNNGHGTHTASTAAGNFVAGASLNGAAPGTASGMAPRAHLSIYKVCGQSTCWTSDVLAGMNAAVADGVHVISMSLGGTSQPFYSDVIAIGAFSAIRRGIFVSCAAGNAGTSDISNEAAWILTVAASTLDRNIRATVRLPNGQQFFGESIFQTTSTGTLPLVYPGAVGGFAAYCYPGSLSSAAVAGKIVICDKGGITGVDKGQAVKNAGGAGMILANLPVEGFTILAENHVLPATTVSYAAGNAIKAYLASTPGARASIQFQGTILGTSPAPVVAYFSSKGPGRQSKGVIKPDITGPGVNILAAWYTTIGSSRFNIISGTSMATPHLSGIAALLRGFHPTWSPAAVKSAIMTTSESHDRSGDPIRNEQFNTATPFEMGSGHVSPNKASDPGLVYDLSPASYVPFLCGLGYTDAQVSAVVGFAVSCSAAGRINEWDLNYPSISVSGLAFPVTVARTVTNVGDATCAYHAQVVAPPGVSVTVTPASLTFWSGNAVRTFTVTFRRAPAAAEEGGLNSTVGLTSTWPSSPTWVSGSLTWVSGTRVVRSPITVAL